MARRIVKKFDIKTLDVIEKEIERLAEVDGIGEKRIGMIKKAWEDQKMIREMMLDFFFVNKDRVKNGTSRIPGFLEGEFRRLDIYERYSYSLIISQKEGLRGHLLSFGSELGNIGSTF